MVAGCGQNCMKILLIVFNIFFWLSGLAILGIGIWVRVDKRIINYQELIKLDADDKYLDTAAYLLIAFGAVVVVVGFCGCCGAIKESKCLLGFYAFLLVLIMGAEIAAGSVAAIYRGEIEGKIDGRLNKTLVEDNGANSVITTAWNYVQYYFDCCGYTGAQDYKKTMGFNSTADKPVPFTCCKLNSNAFNGNPMKGDVSDWGRCKTEFATKPATYSNLHNEGCKAKILQWAKDHAAILIGIGCGIGVMELFGIVFAICLCRHIGKDSSD